MLGAVLAALCAVRPAAGQRLLEWPVRTAAGPEALLAGAAAAFWNPAAAGAVRGRGEVVALDIDGPDVAGLGGLAVAAGLPIGGTVALAAGYQHVGIDGIPQTTTSPVPDPTAPEVAVAEDLLAVAATARLREGLWVGGAVRYWRADEAGRNRTGAAFGTGVLYRSPLPFSPEVGASIQVAGDGTVGWLAGARAEASLHRSRGWAAHAAYGLWGAPGRRRPAHRVTVAADWRRRVTLTAGVSAEPESSGTSLVPVLGASLVLGRYALGIVREELANDFGAVYWYRLGVVF